MAYYAPVSLLALLPLWLSLVLIGYTGMFWALGFPTWREALRESGSSLFTLGFARVDDMPKTLLMFSEAAIGLMLVALVFFRSPQPDRSWFTAAGAVLDAAALTASTLDLPRDANAALCIRAGFIALRRVAGRSGHSDQARPRPGLARLGRLAREL